MTLHADVLAGLALLGAIYLLGIGPLRRGRVPTRGSHSRAWVTWVRGHAVAPWRIAAFFGGLGIIAVALNGPLHDLSDRSLVSAHMVQHLLLTLAAPPLLLLGIPGWLLRPILALPAVAGVGARLCRPLAALAVFTVIFTAWHLPTPYEWALRHHGGHVVEHLLLMAGAVLFWWPVLGALPEWPRLEPPAQLLYLFAGSVAMVPVAAVITLADEVLYPFYGEAARPWGLSPLADQRLGGVIMWVGGPLVLLVAMTIVFFRWVARDVEPAVAPPARGGAHGAS